MHAHAVDLAPLFNGGCVLQSGMPVNLWGHAQPGAKVTVSFNGQEKSASSDSKGRWQLQLDPLEVSLEPRTLTASSGAQVSSVKDVLVGEVWIASGQSNMEWPLAMSDVGQTDLSGDFSDLRFVKVPLQTGLPPAPMSARQLKWRTFEPGLKSAFSAVAFYFAGELRKQLGAPVGIIQSSVGGTPAQAWTPLSTLENRPELKHHADAILGGLASAKQPAQWMAENTSFRDYRRERGLWMRTKNGPAPKPVPPPGPDNPWSQQSPTVLYDNMIVPLTPYTARGVIWYQGEGNTTTPGEYRILFRALIAAWRDAWQQPDMPFLFVQWAGFGELDGKPPPGDWPGLRAAQAFARDTVPNTGMAVAIDVGQKDDIHSKLKKPVGERLARLALNQVYGRNITARGPLMTKATPQDGTVEVSFEHSGGGLKTSDGKDEVHGFEVAGSDGKFHAAEARLISPSSVKLTCTAVKAPEAIRYAWMPWVEPAANLQNSEGLPAEPGEVRMTNSEQGGQALENRSGPRHAATAIRP